MFGVVLSIVGVAFAVWALLWPAAREQTLAKMMLRRRRLCGIGIAVLFIAVVYPFANVFIPPAYIVVRDGVYACCQLVIVYLVGTAAFLVSPSGQWTEAQLRLFHQRLETLILTDRAHVAVGVLNHAFPELPKRVKQDPEEPARESSAYEECFDEVLEDALVYVEFIRAAARHNRPFLAKVLSLQSRAGLFGSDDILTELMFGPDRILPRELAATTNMTGGAGHRYRIPDRCTILHALFDDTEVAEQIACWYPIGDGVIGHISAQARAAATDQDQRPTEKPEKSRWTSPVGTGIWFFRLMVTSAATQGRKYHMWLPYLRYFIDEIVSIIEIPEESAESEFPNPYCYWIYDCLCCCDDLISTHTHLETGNPNRLTVEALEDHNIMTWALQVYGRCVSAVLQAEHLPDRFKRQMVEVLCRDYEAWERSPLPDGTAEIAVMHLMKGVMRRDRETLRDYMQEILKYEFHRDAYKRLFEMIQR
jgi:hypothetical protein